MGAGLIALIAATLDALQTFYKFPEAGERHRTAAAKYGVVRRELDLFTLRYEHADDSAREEALNALEKSASRLGELDESSPGIGTPRPGRRRGKLRRQLRQIEKGEIDGKQEAGG